MLLSAGMSKLSGSARRLRTRRGGVLAHDPDLRTRIVRCHKSDDLSVIHRLLQAENLGLELAAGCRIVSRQVGDDAAHIHETEDGTWTRRGARRGFRPMLLSLSRITERAPE